MLSGTKKVGRSAACIVPTGIATDSTTRFFFDDVVQSASLVSLYGFENEGKLFAGVDHRVNFCILVISGRPQEAEAEFSAFVRHPDVLRDPNRRYALGARDIELINPNTRTCPVFRTRRDAELTKAAYRRVPVLWDENKDDGNPWGAGFRSMFHMSGDSALFRVADDLASSGWQLKGNVFCNSERRMLPLYEAKMIYHFDHRFGDFGLVARGQRAHILPTPSPEFLIDPAYVPAPRYWVDEEEVARRIDSWWQHEWFIGWRDVTDPRSSVRTVVSTIIPRTAVSGKLPLLLAHGGRPWVLAANLASFAFDYIGRQKIGGVSLSMFVMRQLPLLPPTVFGEACPWSDHAIASWIRPRLLELTFTTWDLEGFARDCDWRGGPFRYSEGRRTLLRCELDAAFFHLYGFERNDVEYIMETFPIVKRKDEAAHGDYRTKLQILEIYDAMQRAIDTGEPYQTLLDPPPAHPSVAHPESTRPEWAPAPERRGLALPAMPTAPPLGSPRRPK